MADNKCVPLKSNGHGTTVKSNNFLRAVINGQPFEATIVGGRYDGDETNWIRRSWGRGPLSAGDTTHALVFISCWAELSNGEEYDLSQPDLPVSVGFTHLFPAEDGDETEFLLAVTQGHLILTHNFAEYQVTGSFAFSLAVTQPDGSVRQFEVTEGELYVGPT
ncbi:hypothetical protein [Serratia odorifera]|uniref:hypothetical protein n=1 Tax=Serratia odorifera TaxID=618 RepID=UPI0018E8B8D3|nr:hypothetical protein [Serratia odorifera]MBJ2066889.1 hypothetical protein [Serratia odorifera]HEJ9096991.1 hypothetical protein [Serratia odorifera]